MKAHKFLAAGAVGPISGFAWPAGAWVEAEGPLAPCSRGIHVCRPGDLAHWIHDDELWELEVDGEPIEGLDCLVVARARLVRPIEGWRPDGGRRFAAACVAHAASLTSAPPAAGPVEARELLDDARFMVGEGYVALAAYTAALAVSRAELGADSEAVYRAERAWQSAWIGEEIL
ncbi:MAG TPA: hypothetical protein VHV30_08375 [Polyangiaceae bacterium]|jgi:hypothetical protein|nr:hypothetical protein [Polyangiaceae bacterium]